MFVDLTDVQPIAVPCAKAVTVAVLSCGTPDWLGVLAATGARVLCVDGEGARLLPQDRPDVLVIDAPLPLSPARTALLVRQLCWGKPDLVVLLAEGLPGAAQAVAHDMTFDPAQGSAHVEDAFAVARQLLSHSRLRITTPTPAGASPALLRKPSLRRVDLFR